MFTIYCLSASIINCNTSQDYVGCLTCLSDYKLTTNMTYRFNTASGGEVSSTLTGCVEMGVYYLLYFIIGGIVLCISCCVFCCVKSCNKKPLIVGNGGYAAQANQP